MTLAAAVNWNRPLIALAMICVTIVAYKALDSMHRWWK